MTQSAQQPGENSRDSVAGAGWSDCSPRDLESLLHPSRRGKRPFGWLNPKSLIDSRNDVLAKRFGDPSPAQRERWLTDWYGDGERPLRVDRTDLAEPSFVVLGDTGEGDVSQYAPLPVLAQVGRDTDFMVICSDVIYPAGEVEEYEFKFFHPYRDYPGPIYALPGNHDWYDDLRGFMFHFCGRAQAPAGTGTGAGGRVARALWRRRRKPVDMSAVERMSAMRPSPRQQANLPGPYYVIETGPFEIVAIDTGITGGIDQAQGDWLRTVSRSPKPKILLTGKPIYVNGRIDRCDIEGGGTVEAIVKEAKHNYVAAIGGDIHNYQRYPVAVDGRVIQFIVAGGGGAFTHATHEIDKIQNLGGVTEADFRCYPLRGDSLSFYSTLWDKKFPGDWAIEPDQAAAYMAERLEISPTKDDVSDVVVTEQTRKRAKRIFPLPGQPPSPLHSVFSEFFNWDHPPLFKHLLRVDATAGSLTIACHAATGCSGDDTRAPEDVLTCNRQPDGSWIWAP